MFRHFISLGVVVHLILIYAIFDIYYTSPLVRGTTPHPISHEAGLADRLVLFSADGLRSRSFYEHSNKSPFLHDIIRNGKGSWGVSLSHVPTESRPGHVAMAAGFYEDVSAVALGWKHNPVPFDSMFNRSRETWSWGSPDILPMFAANHPHIHTFTYSSEEEDFARNDAADLDKWVFDHVKEFFETAWNDKELEKRVRANKIVFFLHLLGLDSNGHGYKPYSEKYIDNIRVVDEGIQNIVKLFDKFYGDNKTAFILTADHGMTDWGSHGSGTDDEIVTPLVAWGSGVTESATKRTVNQVDLAPYMAALLGSAVPMNSVGVLPLEMLKGSPRYRYRAAKANLQQMVEQYSVKREERFQHSLPFLFKDYSSFSFSVLKDLYTHLDHIVEKRQLNNAASFCLQYIPRIRDALLYFHRYQRASLGFAVAMTFISWILLIYSVVARCSSLPSLDSSIFRPSASFIGCLTTAFLLLLVQRLPFSNHIYVLLPIWLFSVTFNIYKSSSSLPQFSVLHQKIVETYQSRNLSCHHSGMLIWFIRTSVCGITLCVFVISFTNRSFLSLMTLLMMAYPKLVQTNHLPRWNRAWYACCGLLSVFPQLDTVGNSPSPFLCFLAPLTISAGLFFTAEKMGKWTLPRYLAMFHGVSSIFIGIQLITGSTPWIATAYAWISLPMAFVIPTMAYNGIVERLLAWSTALLIPYTLLSIAYESMFLILFTCLLGVFVRLEMSHLSDLDFLRISFSADASRKKLDSAMDDIHGSFALREWFRSFMLVAFILLGFFGTGNIASLNSFNPSFLRMFLTVFSPFTMAALVVFKIAIPFVFVAIAYTSILHQDRRGVPRLSILVLIITNTMAMVFFFLLKDDGSWLDIGMSISNYLISMFASLFVFVLLHCANFLFPLEFSDLLKLIQNRIDGAVV